MRHLRRPSHRTTLSRLARSAVVVGAVAAVGTAGTWAAFTDTETVDQGAITTGTLSIAVPVPGATNRLTIGVEGLLPGEGIQRAIDLSNDGNVVATAITLSTSATSSSLLDTDTADGLQVTIERCDEPWAEVGSDPHWSYTCGGATSVVLAARPVIGSDLALSGLAAVDPGETDHLRVTLSLPGTAGNDMQGQSTTLRWAFTATQ
jgi:spore coat-associated protein N